MSSKSFEEASEQVRRLMEVAGGSCDAYAEPKPAPVAAPAAPPKVNYRAWEEEVSSPLLHSEPAPVVQRAAPDWLEGAGYLRSSDAPSRDELDDLMQEIPGYSRRDTEEVVSPEPTLTPSPVASGNEGYETECGGMKEVYRGETAHPPITDEYRLLSSVDDAGELLAVFTAFQQAQLDGEEEIQVKLDSGTYALCNKTSRMELVDDVKGLRYIKADMAEMNHYAPLVEDRDIFIWVVPLPEYQGQGDPSNDLGYIHDGWAYLRK